MNVLVTKGKETIGNVRINTGMNIFYFVASSPHTSESRKNLRAISLFVSVEMFLYLETSVAMWSDRTESGVMQYL